MKYYVGVDIGGTNTKIGILDENFKLLVESSMKTNSHQGPEDTFTRIWEKIQELSKNLNLDILNLQGIGLGIPGPVVNNSTVRIAANFSWGNDFNAKQLLEKISNKKVIVENDVRLIAIGEHAFGAAKGYDNVIVVPIGTGISAGIILNGKIISGSGGAAGEFGHVALLDKDMQCGCGLKDCLELNCSAPGIVRIAHEYLKNHIDESFQKLEKIEAYDIFKLQKEGNILADMIVEDFCEKLAKGLSMLINILNPEAIILAGGVSKSSSIIIEKLNKFLPKYTLGISLKGLVLKSCELGDKAGIYGSASLIMNKE